jgi:hypothetical protein
VLPSEPTAVLFGVGSNFLKGYISAYIDLEFSGGTDNIALSPPAPLAESGSPWRTMTDDRDAAAVAFLRILLGCFVGVCRFFSWIERRF